ncbi:NADP-dependent oxidoreductase [Shimazuella sp. AN120528]|uniref:NADP-dependent oxidoreductase n=1 Tax=Shimazuella soli TaxID=1892854 RepID=UPI001F0F5183|nr:NADP-dependent oxidoreductase [Shimazuella soli]MCH5585808.1 NADP-dependent oxidoreductase [Shimazuella soli]
MSVIGKEIYLVKRPKNGIQESDFTIETVPVRPIKTGEVLVKNKYLSLDAGMRMRMEDLKAPIPLYQLGESMYGDAIGEVVESKYDSLQAGDIVRHSFGWREFAIGNGQDFRKIDPHLFPSLSAHLSLGLTSYVGLLDIGKLKKGDTVFVSNAAGSVGSIAGQIARLKGAKRVIGSAGSKEKVDYLKHTLGFDAAFNYRDGSIAEQLRQSAPEGIDLYFDNVGGEQLEAAIEAMNPFGRVILCGSVLTPSGSMGSVSNLVLAIGKRIQLQGFVVTDHLHRAADFNAEFSTWLKEGSITYTEASIEGMENAPRAFVDLLKGKYLGKVVVEL